MYIIMVIAAAPINRGIYIYSTYQKLFNKYVYDDACTSWCWMMVVEQQAASFAHYDGDYVPSIIVIILVVIEF
jgi:hypothetical protein